MAITVNQIAEQCGVSRTTVLRALMVEVCQRTLRNEYCRLLKIIIIARIFWLGA